MSGKKFAQLALLSAGMLALYFALRDLSATLETVKEFFSAVSPITIGFGLAFILNTPLRALEKAIKRRGGFSEKHSRALALLGVYALSAGVLALAAVYVLPSIGRTARSIYVKAPQYIRRAADLYNMLCARLGLEGDFDGLVYKYVELLPPIDVITQRIGEFTVNAGRAVFRTVLGIMTSVYVLADKERIKEGACRLSSALLPEKKCEALKEAAGYTAGTFSRFIGGQILDAALLGALCALGMVIIGLPYPPLVGLVIAITALVPIAGAWVGNIISLLLILLENPFQALIFLIFIVALQQFENNVIYPLVVGDAVGIRGLWVLVAVTLGGALFGVAGMLLAPPAFSVAYRYISSLVNRKNNKKK